MKALYIVTLFARSDDDVINPWMVETIQRLRGKGLEVDVYAPSYRGLKSHNYRGIAVKRFRYCIKSLERLSHERTVPDRIKENKLWLFIVPFYIIGGLLGLFRVCRQKKYDVIHVHWPFPHALFGWLAAKLCRAALVCQFHGVELRWVENSLPAFGALLDWSLRGQRPGGCQQQPHLGGDKKARGGLSAGDRSIRLAGGIQGARGEK